MRTLGVFVALSLWGLSSQAQTIAPISSKGVQIIIATAPAKAGDTIALLTSSAADTCFKSTTAVQLQKGASNVVLSGQETTLAIVRGKLKSGSYVCAVIKGSNGGALVAVPAVEVDAASAQTAKAGSDPNTDPAFEDKTFDYILLGGVEQSDLSAQSSVTEGFYDLTMRERFKGTGGSIWFRSRYLGTPSASSKQNIVAAATDPSGTLTASNLPQSVAAVDYSIGYEARNFSVGETPGELTLNPIFGIGATTPLSATTVVSGFAVPAYGTNECAQLQQRFMMIKGYSPALPGSGVYDATGDIGCVVMPNPASTTAQPLPGTQIKDIGFSNEDRSAFLLKWGAGVRITDRWFVKVDDDATHCKSDTGCSRLTADFTIGQDQAITGGFLRHFVLKADAIIPILSTGFYFFAASSNRLERNQTLSPLILSPVTLATNTATSTCTAAATTVCYPSPNVFILPYKQQDRDYYRIGVGIDARKILTKLFPQIAGKSKDNSTDPKPMAATQTTGAAAPSPAAAPVKQAGRTATPATPMPKPTQQ